MSKYNLSDILNEYIGGGRIGTLRISYRDLVDTMDQLEKSDKVIVRELPGPSGDGKTNREFEVVDRDSAVAGGKKQERGFTVYDYKFGFDPGSIDNYEEEYDFSVGGNDLKLAMELIPDVKPYRFEETMKEDEDYEKDLKAAEPMELPKKFKDAERDQIEKDARKFRGDIQEEEIDENIPPSREDNVIKDLAKADEVIDIIKRMNPDVRDDLLRRLARMGQGMDENRREKNPEGMGQLYVQPSVQREIKRQLDAFDKGDIDVQDMIQGIEDVIFGHVKAPTMENGHVDEYTDEIAEADIDVDLVRATATKANNQITNAAGMADFILDVIDQIGEKEQEGILNNIYMKQAITFLQKAKESSGVKKVDESHAMGGVEAELEAGQIGDMEAFTEEIGPTGIGISGDQLKDLIKLGAIAGVEVYVKDKDGKNVRTVEYTLTNTDFEKDPERIDIDYIDENEGQKALKEHFNRFMFKKYS